MTENSHLRIVIFIGYDKNNKVCYWVLNYVNTPFLQSCYKRITISLGSMGYESVRGYITKAV